MPMAGTTCNTGWRATWTGVEVLVVGGLSIHYSAASALGQFDKSRTLLVDTE